MTSQKPRVLFIDDDKEMMGIYARILRQQHDHPDCALNGHPGFDVEFVMSVEDALHAASNPQPPIDLVIMDIMMAPGRYASEPTEAGTRTGFFLYPGLRAIPHLAEVPFIVLTNWRERRIRDHFAPLPNCTFIKKRDTLPSELFELVAGLLVK